MALSAPGADKISHQGCTHLFQLFQANPEHPPCSIGWKGEAHPDCAPQGAYTNEKTMANPHQSRERQRPDPEHGRAASACRPKAPAPNEPNTAKVVSSQCSVVRVARHTPPTPPRRRPPLELAMVKKRNEPKLRQSLQLSDLRTQAADGCATPRAGAKRSHPNSTPQDRPPPVSLRPFVPPSLRPCPRPSRPSVPPKLFSPNEPKTEPEATTPATPNRHVPGHRLRAFVPPCLRAFVPPCLRAFVPSCLPLFQTNPTQSAWSVVSFQLSDASLARRSAPRMAVCQPAPPTTKEQNEATRNPAPKTPPRRQALVPVSLRPSVSVRFPSDGPTLSHHNYSCLALCPSVNDISLDGSVISHSAGDAAAGRSDVSR